MGEKDKPITGREEYLEKIKEYEHDEPFLKQLAKYGLFGNKKFYDENLYNKIDNPDANILDIVKNVDKMNLWEEEIEGMSDEVLNRDDSKPKLAKSGVLGNIFNSVKNADKGTLDFSEEDFYNDLKKDKRNTIMYQEEMQNLGFDLGPTGVDGVWGPKTDAAVKEYMTTLKDLLSKGHTRDESRNLIKIRKRWNTSTPTTIFEE